jgi:uncharacterized phage-like protein YoqJ
MRVGITGHRPQGLPRDLMQLAKISLWMVNKLLDVGVDEACTGMAIGTDQRFARVCLSLGVPFNAFLPCIDQENKWCSVDKREYECLLKYATSIRYTYKRPYPGPHCMTERNQDMVNWLAEEDFSILLAVSSGKPSGTSNCINKAKKADVGIITLNPFTLEEESE